jgi:hypothetical protein
MMDNYLYEHVEDNFIEINYLEKVYILLVFLTYVYHEAQFRECKVWFL